MDNPFKFLKEEEWQGLTAQATAKRFAPEEVLLKEGSRASGILAIKSGEVKVCHDVAGFNLVISEQGPGAIFGEMSFIEAEEADVSIIAMTEVEVLFITHAQMQEAIKKSPALYGRFFQSLAWILSRRLRETTGKMAQRQGDDWLGT